MQIGANITTNSNLMGERKDNRREADGHAGLPSLAPVPPDSELPESSRAASSRSKPPEKKLRKNLKTEKIKIHTLNMFSQAGARVVHRRPFHAPNNVK